MDDELLDRLRRVFEDELADHRQVLEAQIEVLARPNASTDEIRRAGQEIYRAIHSIKGAARTVDESALESLCHRLEQRIPEARRGLVEGEEVLAVATEALRHIAARSVPSAAPPDGDGEPGNQLKSSPPLDSIRLPAAEVGEIVRRAGELLGTAQRAAGDDAGWEALTRTLSVLGRSLDKMCRALSADPARVVDARASLPIDMQQALALVGNAQAMVRERFDAEHSRRAALSVAVRDISERTRRLGLVPLSTLGAMLENAALETCTALGKLVAFNFSAQGVQLDRRVRDGLREPLLHLVRNAVDHGIETSAARLQVGKPIEGRVWVKARIIGRDVQVSVGDDGAGFDVEALRRTAIERGMQEAQTASAAELRELAFEPGVSTQRQATVISGRGVGLDIVRQRVAALHGHVRVGTNREGGTTIAVIVPVDLSVVPSLIVRVRESIFAIATTSVERAVRVPRDALVPIEGRMHAKVDEDWWPVADLGDVLMLRTPADRRYRKHATCMVLRSAKKQVLVRVDELVDQCELVIRALSRRIRSVPFVTAAAVLPDGAVAPVLDGVALGRRLYPARFEAEPPPSRAKRILVADDSLTTRELLRMVLESMGYEVVVVPDGNAAWARLTAEQDRFDLLLSDIEMPRLDGFGLLGRVRAAPSLSELPVVLVTALEMDEHRRRAVSLGASAYVVKSRFDQAALLSVIERLT